MPYYTKYQCQANNLNGQYVYIRFLKLMDPIPPGMEEPASVVLPLVEFKVEFMNGNEEKFDPVILSQKATIKVRAKRVSGSDVNNEMFYTNIYNEWMVIAEVDNKVVFKGFITNENEPYVFKDKPYNIVVTATDGLGLLKNSALSDINGNKFNGRNTMLSYVLGALRKTELDLDLRIYCNIYYQGMQNRWDFGSPDMFTQCRLHHRTFLSESNEFINCYDALETILGKWCILYQNNGTWVINHLPEMQYNTGPTRYYTVYDYAGNKKLSVNDQDLPCVIGAYRKIQPINLDQLISYQPPVKSVKTVYNYEVPSDLINNQSLKQLGTFIGALSGQLYSSYDIVGWTLKKGTLLNQQSYTGAGKASIRIEKDAYNTELLRYYRVDTDGSLTANNGLFIINNNDDFFVEKGDKIQFNFSVRPSFPFNISTNKIQVAILKTGENASLAASWYTLDSAGVWYNDASRYAVGGTYTNGLDDKDGFFDFGIIESNVPASGSLYLKFMSERGASPGFFTYFDFKAPEIIYNPYLKGSKFYTKGDYWMTSQNVNIKDTIDDEIKISDSPKKLLKGAIWDNTGLNLTNPTWYRQGYTESKHFKELANFGRYRSQYKRLKRISGTFKGIMFNPDGTTIEYPLNFHKHFTVENSAETFMLTAPLDIDYLNCRWRGTLISTLQTFADSITEGDTHTFNNIFK